MTVRIRPITAADMEACGRVLYDAFRDIADRHQFPTDFPAVDFATRMIEILIADPAIYGVVAEHDGEIVGSSFLTERNPIRAVGPVSVAPAWQGRGAGRRLMHAVLERARGAVGVRLLQDSFNTTSLSLYASLGFDARDSIALMTGTIRGELPPSIAIRPLETDAERMACAELCTRVFGFERTEDLRHAPPMFGPLVASRDGRVTAYATAPRLWPLNHAVAESEEDMQALLLAASAASPEPISFLLPLRHASLFRWCLSNELRVLKLLTLMAIGPYPEPQGYYLPSAGY